MRIILTHEHADFDALASLYGAWLLDEQALPVLPRRMNRNLRAFLTLYGGEFPFVDARDLPAAAVTDVLLVDTQSLITLRGMGAQTRVRVLDHHPRRDDLPDDWDITIESVGANTTVLVEALQAENGHFSVPQATLLLLGIYEDTGSLSYASTTPRDIHAAGYLVAHGASLELAADFLNPPLTTAQRALYEKLVAQAENLQIHGQRILLTCGDARDMQDEISSLAHKLRDLFEPDALFVLVLMRDGVRLVARSTSDRVDVGRIAAQLGGGGHDRAAAALIQEAAATPEAALEKVCQRLKALLPQMVQPAVTVAQIMSRGPQVLSPETTAREAALLMTRFGYEGYPVVADGQVVGLLTRRAVDRALAHQLNLPAKRIMQSGQVTVRPDDSIQTLQLRMMESGWGQIPVVDAQNQVIGIVTRTDLLNTLSPPAPHSGLRNLSSRLQQALPPGRFWLLQQVAEQAGKLHMPAYVVGGFVRDLLLDRPSLDYDVVVEGEARQLAQALSAAFGGRVLTHRRFGTAKWFLPESLRVDKDLPEFLDLISARTEFYEHPTALPTVRRGSIKLDLHRRDFTINTLALRLDGRHFGALHDYWGGLRDLERGLVRVLHSLSFVDDPTRMMRAVRFEQRFGFQIEARTLELMSEARPLLDKLSGKRIRHEIDLMLDEPPAAAMLQRLHHLHLLEAVSPPLPWDAFMESGFDWALNTSPAWDGLTAPGGWPLRRALGYALWFLPLGPAEVEKLTTRLRFSMAMTRALKLTADLWQERAHLATLRPSAFVERVEGVPLLGLYAIFCRLSDGDAAPLRASLDKYAREWRHIRPQTTGDDLKARGLPPGRRYAEILSRLRAAWLDGEVRSPEAERRLLDQLLSE